MYIKTSKTTSFATVRKLGMVWIVDASNEFFKALAEE
jgi:hypothetical protein